MAMTITPITAYLGAEIHGINLSQSVTNEEKNRLLDAWAQHAVLVIRAQKFTPEEFANAARIFGEIMPQQVKKFNLEECPEVGFVSSSDLPRGADGKLHVRGEQYHTDHSNHEAPPAATTLFAVDLPSYGGDTQFVDVRAAFDDLPDEERKRIVNLRSRHTYEATNSPRKMPKLSVNERAAMPDTVQPVVIRHPANGRLALFLNTARMEGIEGMSLAEGTQLIDRLYRHATQNKYEYRHKWLPGDMVIWDNRSVLHQANADYDPEESRFLYRVVLKGEPLQAAS